MGKIDPPSQLVAQKCWSKRCEIMAGVDNRNRGKNERIDWLTCWGQSFRISPEMAMP